MPGPAQVPPSLVPARTRSRAKPCTDLLNIPLPPPTLLQYYSTYGHVRGLAQVRSPAAAPLPPFRKAAATLLRRTQSRVPRPPAAMLTISSLSSPRRKWWRA